MERHLKRVNDVTNRSVDEDSIEAIVMAFLDPLMRQHTATLHASSRSCAELKRAVVEFVNVRMARRVVMDGEEEPQEEEAVKKVAAATTTTPTRRW